MRKYFFVVAVFIGVLAAIVIYVRWAPPLAPGVTFFDVGQGDSALIIFSNGQKMLVDCGPDGKILSKLGQKLRFFDRTIDYLLITHFDNDHYGGCVDVVDRYQIKQIISNGAEKINDPYWRVWEQKSRVLPTEVVNGKKVWNYGDDQIELLSPDPGLAIPEKYRDSNNSSIVFRLTQGDHRILFMGDAELPLEMSLITRDCPATSTPCSAVSADYLKLGHHGSDSSTGDDWVSAVDPRVAIVSVGKNKYGHPSLRVKRHLERAGVEFWRTDEKGDIMVKK